MEHNDIHEEKLDLCRMLQDVWLSAEKASPEELMHLRDWWVQNRGKFLRGIETSLLVLPENASSTQQVDQEDFWVKQFRQLADLREVKVRDDKLAFIAKKFVAEQSESKEKALASALRKTRNCERVKQCFVGVRFGRGDVPNGMFQSKDQQKTSIRKQNYILGITKVNSTPMHPLDQLMVPVVRRTNEGWVIYRHGVKQVLWKNLNVEGCPLSKFRHSKLWTFLEENCDEGMDVTDRGLYFVLAFDPISPAKDQIQGYVGVGAGDGGVRGRWLAGQSHVKKIEEALRGKSQDIQLVDLALAYLYQLRNGWEDVFLFCLKKVSKTNPDYNFYAERLDTDQVSIQAVSNFIEKRIRFDEWNQDKRKERCALDLKGCGGYNHL